MLRCMRHGSRRRNRLDALQPRAEPTWLTVNTMAGELVRAQLLEPLANLQLVLDTEIERMEADGWIIPERHSHSCAAFFAERDEERVGVMIVRVEPGKALPRR